MYTPTRIALAALTSSLFALAGCDSGPEAVDAEKPADVSADAYGRLCQDQGLPDDCNICEVRGWYGDGECDDFCSSPDPDCDTNDPGCSWDTPSRVGDTAADLGDSVTGSTRYNMDDIDAIPVIDSRQIFTACQHLGFVETNQDFDLVFEAADEGEFTVNEVTYEGNDYDWVKFYAGDTQVGVIFVVNTLEIVGEVSDGDIMGCGTVEPTNGDVTCDWDTPTPFGDSSEDLDEMRVDVVSLSWEDAEELTEVQSRQIFAAALHLEMIAGDEDFDVVFEVADEGYFNIATVDADGTLYDWIQFYAGDTEVGVVFERGTTTVVAEIGDGDILGCVAN